MKHVIFSMVCWKKNPEVFWEVSEVHIISLTSGKIRKSDSAEICVWRHWKHIWKVTRTYSSRSQERIIFQNMCSLPACFKGYGLLTQRFKTSHFRSKETLFTGQTSFLGLEAQASWTSMSLPIYFLERQWCPGGYTRFYAAIADQALRHIEYAILTVFAGRSQRLPGGKFQNQRQ